VEDLKDQHRPGRPITETTPVNIERVRAVIENDPWCSYDEIEAETSLSRGTIHTIIHMHLKMRKLTSRWVPHELTEKNRQDRVRMCEKNLAKFEESKWRLSDVVTGDESWFYHRQIGKKQANKSWVAEGEKARAVVRIDRFEPKTMFTIFFRTSGVVHISHLKPGETINHQTYLKDSIRPLVRILNEQRPQCGTKNLKFHHDNARPHTHSSVIAYLERQNFTIMDHPPYSPDLAPSDFWLFNYIKQRLSDHTSVESLNREITEIVSSIPEKEYRKTFDKWLERMECCIKNKGHYFEHLLK
jgi:histone-lysine N-methyltransferase SETMAR